MAVAHARQDNKPVKLSTHNLVLQIGNKRIIDDVSFDAPCGSVVGVLGPNGSGKTTLLRSTYRALSPKSGHITIDGHDLWQLSAKRAAQCIAAMTQDHPVEFEFSVREIVRLGRLPHKSLFDRTSRQDEEIVVRSAALAHATHLLDHMFGTLSGGERQRVLLARALAQQPQVLILDEPTNHLDIGGQLDLLELISGIGITVIAALHDLNLAAAVCDHIVLLRDRKVVASGEPSQVLTPTILAQVYGVDAHCSVHPLTGKLLIAFDTLPTSGTPDRQQSDVPATLQ